MPRSFRNPKAVEKSRIETSGRDCAGDSQSCVESKSAPLRRTRSEMPETQRAQFSGLRGAAGMTAKRPRKPVLEGIMNERCLLLRIIVLLIAPVLTIHGQEKLPLMLVQKIPMPNVKGRLDHFGVDLAGRRLFVAALGDDQNTVEVIDLKSGKRVFSIPGQSKPQGFHHRHAQQQAHCGYQDRCALRRHQDRKIEVTNLRHAYRSRQSWRG